MNQTKILLSIICSVAIPFSWGCGGQDNPELDSAESAALRLRGPIILSHPSNQAVYVGMPTTFNVAATGFGPLSFQWFKNGRPIAGATSPTYSTSAELADNGSAYQAVVADRLGIRTHSRTASLSVKTWTTFVPTGNMVQPRHGHTATLLWNGKVLITGGFDGTNALDSAELYDPATGTFTPTGRMRIPRHLHTATLLSDGRVLVVGAYPPELFPAKASAELYDPASGTFSPAGELPIEQLYLHSATLLSDGRVLIAGGESWHWATTAAFLFDPLMTAPIETTGSLAAGRYDYHTSTRLQDGKVLLAGGVPRSELYDPAIGTFSATGDMTVNRFHHTATLLPDGKVFIAGGYNIVYNVYVNLDSTETYDSRTGAFTPTAAMGESRSGHTATLLPSGRVLIAGGGTTTAGPSATTQLYDPATRTFIPTTNMTMARSDHTATLLPNGKVLIVSGVRAELYE